MARETLILTSSSVMLRLPVQGPNFDGTALERGSQPGAILHLRGYSQVWRHVWLSQLGAEGAVTGI